MTALLPSRAALYMLAANLTASSDGENAVADVNALMFSSDGCFENDELRSSLRMGPALSNADSDSGSSRRRATLE